MSVVTAARERPQGNLLYGRLIVVARLRTDQSRDDGVATGTAARVPADALPAVDRALLDRMVAGVPSVTNEAPTKEQLAVLGYIFGCRLSELEVRGMAVTSDGFVTGYVGEPVNHSVFMGRAKSMVVWFAHVLQAGDATKAEIERFSKLLRAAVAFPPT